MADQKMPGKAGKNFIVFLAAADALKDDMGVISRGGAASPFTLDPSILLPAELPPDSPDTASPEFSLEAILAGMLRLLSAGKKRGSLKAADGGISGTPPKSGDIVEADRARLPPEWLDYYRGFIFAVKPEIFHEFTNAAIVKADNGEFGTALEISGILEALFPASPGTLLGKALILERRAAALEKNGRPAERENAEALDAYETALAQDPVLPDTLFNAGFFFVRIRDFARAKEYFSRYLSVLEESESPSGNVENAGAEDPFGDDSSAGKKARAEKIISDINSRGLDDEAFHRAYEYINQGNDEKGLFMIREFIERHPKVWNGWFVLGWALRKLGRYSDSLESYKKALELGGDGGDLKNETAICLMETGDLKGARKELEAALREEPENIKIISNLGVLAQKSGNHAEAAAFFRTVLELDPQDPLAKHFL